jgi:transcriptional regulator with XRE-family HTH domain
MDAQDDSPRAVLARNLNKLMAASKGARRDLSSPQRIEALSGFSHSQVQRIRRGEIGATIDRLGELAAAFSLAPWQLLVPTLNAWQDANGKLRIETPMPEAAKAVPSANFKRALAAVGDLSDEEKAALAEEFLPADSKKEAEKLKAEQDRLLKRHSIKGPREKKTHKKSA